MKALCWPPPKHLQNHRTTPQYPDSIDRFPGTGKKRDVLWCSMKPLHRPPQEPLANHRSTPQRPDAIRLVSRPREKTGFVVFPYEGSSSALTRAAGEPRTAQRCQDLVHRFPAPGKKRDLLWCHMNALHRPPQEPLAINRTTPQYPDSLCRFPGPRKKRDVLCFP